MSGWSINLFIPPVRAEFFGASSAPIHRLDNPKSKMDNALDVEGLPEAIYTSEGNAFLHLPGVIVAESSTGETRYLLGDGPFDRLRTGWAVCARRWMTMGWW